MSLLLHPDTIAWTITYGRPLEAWLTTRAEQILQATADMPDPDVSIVIRSRNDGRYLEQLFDDIAAQIFTGAVEVIVVDTESRDDTVARAQVHGAHIIRLRQDEFTYPMALNQAFEVARNPWVVTLVGHSSLSSRLFLKSLAYWTHEQPGLGGIYGIPLANHNASRWERLSVNPRVWQRPRIINKLSFGIMGANCSILKREVWERFGGYDERYAGGGEDRALAQTMLEHDITIVREPLCTVFHSHGLSARNALRQVLHWGEVAKKPTPFKTEDVHKRRPDLR